jgi:hypothetical protein
MDKGDAASVVSYISTNELKNKDINFNSQQKQINTKLSYKEDVEYIPNLTQNQEQTDFIKNLKDEIRLLREENMNLQSNHEITLSSNNLLETELQELRNKHYELKSKNSRINEDSFKVENSNLKNIIKLKDKEIELLKNENKVLREQYDDIDNRVSSIISQGKTFREQTNFIINNLTKDLDSYKQTHNYQTSENKNVEKVNVEYNYSNQNNSNEKLGNSGQLGQIGHMGFRNEIPNSSLIEKNNENEYNFNANSNDKGLVNSNPLPLERDYNYPNIGFTDQKHEESNYEVEDNLLDHEYKDNNLPETEYNYNNYGPNHNYHDNSNTHSLNSQNKKEIENESEIQGNTGENVGIKETKKNKQLKSESGSTENKMDNPQQKLFGKY